MAMFIQTEVTPNPATLKFLPHATVMSEGTQFYQDPSSAGNSILAQKLFEIRHYTEKANSGNGFGIDTADSRTNVYTDVLIWKVA